MRKFVLQLLLCFSLAVSADNGKSFRPVPYVVDWKGTSFVMPEVTTVGYTDPSLAEQAERLRKILRSATGNVVTLFPNQAIITLSLTDQGFPGSYMLKITEENITIEGRDVAGIVSAIATMRQLLPAQPEPALADSLPPRWLFPCADIIDRSVCGQRILEIDTKQFFAKDEVKELLDCMSLYKLTGLYWRKMPVEAGKPVRKATGYTAKDVRELEKYAAERGITLQRKAAPKEVDEQIVVGTVTLEEQEGSRKLVATLRPHILAVADRGWQPNTKSHETIITRITQEGTVVEEAVPTGLQGCYNHNVVLPGERAEVTCSDASLVIRYTTDGTAPTLQSPVYENPIPVTQPTTLAFSTFDSEGNVVETKRGQYVIENCAPGIKPRDPSMGMLIMWYKYKGNRCDEVEKAPLEAFFITSDLRQRPKECKGHVGLHITGYLLAPEDGVYTIHLKSDEGSTLKLDGRMLIDNGGMHKPKEITAQCALKAGYHPMEIRYFDHDGGMLDVKVITPSGKPITRYWHEKAK